MKIFNQDTIDSLKDFGEEPDQEVWTGLRHDLIKQKNKKRSVILFAVLCLLALSGSVSMLMLKPENTSTALSIPQKPGVQGSNPGSNFPEAVNPAAMEKTLTNGPAQHLIPQKDKTLNLGQGSGSTNSLHSDASTDLPEITQTSEASSQMLIGEQVALGLQELKKISTRPLLFPDLSKADLPHISKPHRTYFASLILMPAISHRILAGDKSLISQRNQNETPQDAVALGISFGKRVNRSLDISLGLQYHSYKQKITHNWSETLISNDSVLVKKRNSNETFYHHFINSKVLNQTESYTNRFEVVQIPVSFTIHRQVSLRTSFYASAGLQMNYVLRSRVNVNYQTSSGLLIETTPHQSSYSRFSAGIHAGIGLSRRLNKDYELSGGLQASLSSNYFIKGGIKEYPYLSGLQLGVRKYF